MEATAHLKSGMQVIQMKATGSPMPVMRRSESKATAALSSRIGASKMKVTAGLRLWMEVIRRVTADLGLRMKVIRTKIAASLTPVMGLLGLKVIAALRSGS